MGCASSQQNLLQKLEAKRENNIRQSLNKLKAMLQECDVDASGTLTMREGQELCKYPESREILIDMCGEKCNLEQIVTDMFWEEEEELSIEGFLVVLAHVARGGALPTKEKIIVTISSATPSPEGRLVLKVSMLSGDTFDVSCNAGQCAGNVAAQIRKDRALEKSVKLVTRTGVVLQESDVLPEALLGAAE